VGVVVSLRTLMKHIAIYGSGVWAGKAIGFIMIPFYTRALNPADYGALELASRSIDIAALVLALGMVAALIRFHAEVRSDAEREKVIRTAVVFLGIMGLAASGLCAWMAAPLSALIFGTSRYAFAFRLALIAMGLELATAVPLALLRLHERSALFAGVNLGRLLIALGLNIYLVVMRRMGIVGVFTSNLIGVSVVLVVLIAATRRYWRFSIDYGMLKRMLAYSIPLVPSSLAMFVLNFGDRYFLRSYWGLHVLGVYALGYKLCLVMPALVMEPLGLAWSAVVFEVANRDDADRIYARYFNGYMFCVAFFSVALAALSRDVVGVMADAGYRGASAVVPVVLLGFVAWASVNVFEIGALLSKRTWLRTLSNSVAAVAAIVAYAILIPRFGAMGAAWATVIGFAAMSVTSYITSARAHPIPYDLRRAAGLLVLGVVTYGASTLVPGVGLESAIGRVLVVATFPVLLYLAGYFEPENVAAVLGKRKAESAEQRVEVEEQAAVTSDLSEKGTLS
jgi:O-antigen/teichoic acid export membrane protein